MSVSSVKRRKLYPWLALAGLCIFIAGWVHLNVTSAQDRNWDERNFDIALFLGGCLFGALGLIAFFFYAKSAFQKIKVSDLQSWQKTLGKTALAFIFVSAGVAVGISTVMGLMFNMLNRHGV